MNCIDAINEGIYIKCNNFNEFREVLTYLGNRGMHWQNGSSISETSLLYYATDVMYPIYVVRGSRVNSVCWANGVVVINGTYRRNKIRHNEVVSVLDFSMVSLN